MLAMQWNNKCSLNIQCKDDVVIVKLLVVNWFLLYLSVTVTTYDVLLFRSVKVKLLLSVVSNVLALLNADKSDIVISCAVIPHAGWIYVSHKTDNDVAQTSVATTLPIDGGPVAWQLNLLQSSHNNTMKISYQLLSKFLHCSLLSESELIHLQPDLSWTHIDMMTGCESH